MKNAVLKVVKDGYSIRGVARSTNLSYATLRKYVAKYKSTKRKKRKSLRFSPNYEVNQVYSKELEDILEEYLLAARKLRYGLTSEIIKRMSYDLAIKNNLKVPKSWKENRMAGKHWLYGYLRRHPVISDILSWSRKFRPPIKAQFNTTVERANPSVEEVTLSEKDLEKFMIEESRLVSDETSNLSFVDAVLQDSSPSLSELVEDSSSVSSVAIVENNLSFGDPVIISVIKKPKKHLKTDFIV